MDLESAKEAVHLVGVVLSKSPRTQFEEERMRKEQERTRNEEYFPVAPLGPFLKDLQYEIPLAYSLFVDICIALASGVLIEAAKSALGKNERENEIAKLTEQISHLRAELKQFEPNRSEETFKQAFALVNEAIQVVKSASSSLGISTKSLKADPSDIAKHLEDEGWQTQQAKKTAAILTEKLSSIGVENLREPLKDKQ